MKEKRLHPRIEEHVSVTVTVEVSPEKPSLEKKSFICLIKDLSISGLQISTFTEIPVGTRIRLHISFLHPARAFKHTGRVVYTKKQRKQGTYASGIEFTDTGKGVLAAWKAIIKQMIGTDNLSGVERQ